MASLIPRPSSNDNRPNSGGGPQPGLSATQPGLSSFPSRTASTRSLQQGKSMSDRLQNRGARAASNDSRQSQSQRQFIKSSGSDMAGRPKARKGRRVLRPQYPLNSEERHVEYILVASFDIDKGPTMEHQYPAPISDNEHMLAELMMPDQTHMRSEDWTIFFLHKDSGEQEEQRKVEQEKRRVRKEDRRQRRAVREAHGPGENGADHELSDEDESSEKESEDEGGEGPPLIYVLNLVNTKMLDNPTTNRGALVKAMAICTRHPFLHIYKPLLLLALQDYFKTPEVDTLKTLYDAVNAMDLSLLPRFSTFERRLLLSTDKKNLFTEKFERMAEQADPNIHAKSAALPMIPRDTRDFESRVVYNSIPIPIKVPSAIAVETVGDFSIIKLIQTFSAPHTTSPQPFALHPHLTPNGAFTHPILVLVNAVLTQKRIIFLGHQRPSGEVAEAVLAACALCSGTVLRGFTRHAFPYTDLTKIDDLLNVPGFIAGVTNSIFANHLEWWDLLCDLSTGRMKISTKIEPAMPTEGLANFQQQHQQYAPSNSGVLPVPPGGSGGSSDPKVADPTGDIAFMDDITRSITARHGEHALRSKWHQYIVRFLRLASAFEETVFGASALDIGAAEADAATLGVSGHGCVWPDEITKVRELAAFAWRIEGWRNTRSYYALVQDIAATWNRQPVRSLDLSHQLDRLRLLKLSREESAKVFLALRAAVKTYDEICQFLSASPENQASIFYVGLGLFHPEREVREATAELLERIRDHEVGRHYWPQLGRFSRVALLRIQRDMMDAGGEDRDGEGEEDDEDGVAGTGFSVGRHGLGGRPFS